MRLYQLACVSLLLTRGLPQTAKKKFHRYTCAKETFTGFLFTQLFAPTRFNISPVCQKSTHQQIATMSAFGSDYSKHNIQIVKYLGSDGVDRAMDIIVAGVRKDATEHVVFFGGDVQDYPEEMQSHRDNGKYVRWNSLATAGRLCERFPQATVLVIKPQHMHLKTFSVYSQFVESNDFGIPAHSADYGGWKTLAAAYAHAVCKAVSGSGCEIKADGKVGDKDKESSSDLASGDSPPPKNSTQAPHAHSTEDTNAEKASTTATSTTTTSYPVDSSSLSTLPNTPIHIIGFSKGCVVLNQLTHELKTVGDHSEVQDFLSRVRNMTWLDGGHSGGSKTWVTDPSVLQLLADKKMEIQVHVTPYQVKDEMRQWIGKEKKRFVEILRKAGANITDTLHFDEEPKSIENHFRVLEVF